MNKDTKLYGRECGDLQEDGGSDEQGQYSIYRIQKNNKTIFKQTNISE